MITTNYANVPNQKINKFNTIHTDNYTCSELNETREEIVYRKLIGCIHVKDFY